MINNHPDLQNQGQYPVSQKLVLPAVHTEDALQPAAYTQRMFVHPDQLRPQVAVTSTNPFAKLVILWRTDPAYKVLMVAAAMVFVAGIIFATFLFHTFAQSTASTPGVTTTVKTVNKVNTSPKTRPPVNLPPTFPTPSGGKGSNNNSSQPPKSTPVVLPTLTSSGVTPQPTQQPQDQNLQLQITNIPQQVRNNSDVQVTVTANQPGVSIKLKVTFDNSLLANFAGPQQTDDNGMTTLNWFVNNFSFKRDSVARITAYATDQNGQQVSSQTVSVEVSNRFM